MVQQRADIPTAQQWPAFLVQQTLFQEEECTAPKRLPWVKAISEKDFTRHAGRTRISHLGNRGLRSNRDSISRIAFLELERLRQEAGFYLSDRVIQDARAFCGEV